RAYPVEDRTGRELAGEDSTNVGPTCWYSGVRGRSRQHFGLGVPRRERAVSQISVRGALFPPAPSRCARWIAATTFTFWRRFWPIAPRDLPANPFLRLHLRRR